MARKLSLKEAKQRAGRFCALRERSPQEVIEKTRSWGLSEGEAYEITEALVKDGFVNEQRFANAFCHDKFEFNSWGKQKIRSAIYSHRLSSRVVDIALERIDQEKYESRLFDLALKKWTTLTRDEGMKKKQKTASYLASKGFELDLIWNTIESVIQKGH